jgi:hypothetical protein
MDFKNFNYGIKTLGKIHIFKMKYSMSYKDAITLSDELQQETYNCTWYYKLAPHGNHCNFTIAGAVTDKEFMEIMAALQTQSKRHHQRMLDNKFYLAK